MKIKMFFCMVWVAAIIVAGFLATLPNVMVMQENTDKMLHITIFCFLAIGPVMLLSRPISIVASGLFLMVLGVLIEAAQAFIPGRQSSLEDIISNGAGVALGLLVGYLLRSGYRQDVKLREIDHDK